MLIYFISYIISRSIKVILELILKQKSTLLESTAYYGVIAIRSSDRVSHWRIYANGEARALTHVSAHFLTLPHISPVEFRVRGARWQHHSFL